MAMENSAATPKNLKIELPSDTNDKKITYNKNIFSEFYKRIRSGWEISESDEKM